MIAAASPTPCPPRKAAEGGGDEALDCDLDCDLDDDDDEEEEEGPAAAAAPFLALLVLFPRRIFFRGCGRKLLSVTTSW